MKVYFASPFFNEEQVEREERLKKKLRDLGFNVFSPKEASLLKKDSSLDEQENTFKMNLKEISECDIIFVVTDGKDVGTIWEAGFCYGLNFNKERKTKIVYYCETLNGGKFNLMLARSGDIVITDYNELENLESMIKNGKRYEGFIE